MWVWSLVAKVVSHPLFHHHIERNPLTWLVDLEQIFQIFYMHIFAPKYINPMSKTLVLIFKNYFCKYVHWVCMKVPANCYATNIFISWHDPQISATRVEPCFQPPLLWVSARHYKTIEPFHFLGNCIVFCPLVIV